MITGVQAHKLCSYDTLRARRTVICISLRVSRKQGNAKRGKGKWRGGTEGGTESKSHRQHGRTMQKKSESVYALTDKKRERQKERESWRGSKRGQSESKRELVACASAPLADAFTVAYFQGVRSLCASERERERGESLP